MNICNQLVVTIMVCFGLMVLPAMADEALDSTTGATLKSTISMRVIKPSCGTKLIAKITVDFGTVSPRDLKTGTNIESFYVILNCESDQGHFYVKLQAEPIYGSNPEDGYIATNRTDVALFVTWRKANLDDTIQNGTPVKLNQEYYIDKMNKGDNEFRFNAQLVSWPLNTLIEYRRMFKEQYITSSASILLTYI